jgi:hypothetical protein
MSFFRVSNPVASAFDLKDLGITIAASASNVILSDQFSVNDLYLSADLEAAIIGGDLTVQIDYGTGFASIAAVDYTNRDALASFLNVYEITNENNNEDLVDGSDASSLHMHDSIYFTETELGATAAPSGASLIGVDDSTFGVLVGDDVQEVLADVDSKLQSFDLDGAYDNDTDGILHVDGVSKSLDLESDNANDIKITRKSGTDKQDALLLDVSGDELVLGSATVGVLAELDVRIKTDLIIEGNLTVTGTVTDSTVDELNITNANIRLRDGATAIAGADAYIEVERGTSGNDAQALWDETADRWKAGIVGDMSTIALIEKDEVITGVWEFQGGATSEPSMYLTDKASAPSTVLGAAGQIPMAMINNKLAVYDKSNSRSKWLSVHHEHVMFTGRNSMNNSNEYAMIGMFSSFETGFRLHENMTLVGIKIQCADNATFTARVRKNDSATNVASLAVAAAKGAQDATLNVDFSQGDEIQVFIDGTSVARPIIVLEFAQKF